MDFHSIKKEVIKELGDVLEEVKEESIVKLIEMVKSANKVFVIGAGRVMFTVQAFAKRLNASLAIIDKRRDAPNVAKAMAVIGDVKGKNAIIMDDMVDTAGTLVEAADALLAHDANEVHCCCSHPVLSGPAMDRIENSGLKNLIVTDTIPLNHEAAAAGKFVVISVAELFGEAIRRIHEGSSVSVLFQ